MIPLKSTGSWNLFVSVEGRAVVRNIFLDGNSWVESHGVDKRPFVGELGYGLSYTGKMLDIRICPDSEVQRVLWPARAGSLWFGELYLSPLSFLHHNVLSSEYGIFTQTTKKNICPVKHVQAPDLRSLVTLPKAIRISESVTPDSLNGAMICLIWLSPTRSDQLCCF